MKKITFLIILICFSLLLSACDSKTSDDANSKHQQSFSDTDGTTETADITYGTFSYKEDSQKYKPGDKGVINWDLKNTESCEVKDGYAAITIAHNEIKVIYDRISADFDEEEQVWRITFSLKDYESAKQTVYIDKDGKTIMYLWGIK